MVLMDEGTVEISTFLYLSSSILSLIVLTCLSFSSRTFFSTGADVVTAKVSRAASGLTVTLAEPPTTILWPVTGAGSSAFASAGEKKWQEMNSRIATLMTVRMSRTPESFRAVECGLSIMVQTHSVMLSDAMLDSRSSPQGNAGLG